MHKSGAGFPILQPSRRPTFAENKNAEQMNDKITYKSTPACIEVKAEGQEEGRLHIKAYVLAFGNVDSWGDVIEPGACDAFLASANAERMALCYQHDLGEVIGVITDKGVDGRGMWIEADILDTTTGQDVQKLIRAGAVKEFSIGYVADKWSYEQTADGSEIRHLEAITIWEASPVTRAANPLAVIVDAKGETGEAAIRGLDDEQLESLKNAVDEEYFRRFIDKL